MPSKVWDEITHPFPNLNGYAVEVWEGVSISVPYFIIDEINYPHWDLS